MRIKRTQLIRTLLVEYFYCPCSPGRSPGGLFSLFLAEALLGREVLSRFSHGACGVISGSW